MNALKTNSCITTWIVTILSSVFLMAGSVWAQDHDLVISDAPDVASPNAANWKSADIKVGADFGDASIPNIVQRGVDNHIYARFRVNGMQDDTIPSGDIQIKFFYRSATIGSTPPDLSDPSWTYIDRLLVTYITADGPLAITQTWPTDFPSVTNKYVTWSAPISGSHFHIAAEVVYPSGIVDENSGDNVAVSLYESQAGLLDVVLLHDVSGSMKYFTYNGFTYMQQSISKASMFLASMPEVHRFSVVAFSSKYTGGYDDVWPTLAPWLREATDVPPDNNKTSAISAISGLTASGATPLGQGLERAIQILTTPLEPDRKRVIVILSDGYENTATPRACSGADAGNPCVGQILVSQLQTNDIKVFSIALGTSAWTQCLECLANQSQGQWYSSPTASVTLAKVYLDILQDSTSDDLYSADLGTTGGGDDAYQVYFEGEDNVLYFILSWDDLNASLNLKLRSPTGRRLRTKVYEGKGYMVVKVDSPVRGTWRYSVTGDEGKNYLVAVRSDRVGVRLRIDTTSAGVVDSPIKIKARLMHGKKPVTNAKLMATIQIPVVRSLDTILQETSRKHIMQNGTSPVNPLELRKNPDISPRSAFIKKLMGDQNRSLVKTRTVKIQLRHIGKGVYTGLLKRNYTTTAGEYTVNVTTSNKKYLRSFSKQLRMRPGKVSHEKSFAEMVLVKPHGSIAAGVNKPIWLLRVYIKDRFGNAVCESSLRKRIKTQVEDARISMPEISLGALQQVLKVRPGMKPKLKKVILDGRKVKIRKGGRVN